MLQWIDTLVQGILLGGFFALSGLGLSLSFGIMRIVNIAHGDLVVVAAYLGVVVVSLTGMNPLWAIFIIAPVMAALGYALQRFVLNRVIGSNELTPMLITFGLSIVLHNVLQELFSADFQGLDAGPIEVASLELGGINIGWLPLAILAVTLCIYGLVHHLMATTRLGCIVRATVDDPEASALMGVDTRRIYAIGMAISMAIVAIAGWLFGIKSSFSPMTGGDQLLFSFEAVIIGGMGSIWGSLLGGIALGLAQVVGLHIHASWGAFAGHLVFFAFLFIKPNGLLTKGSSHA